MDYEQAITISGGYGRYQMRLFLLLLPTALTFVFGVSSMSYVMPAAVCEFEISKYKQGLIYSAIYLGMVPSGAIWGAVSDIIGRRKTLVLTCGISGIFELLSGFSINYWFLFGCKFLSGCATAGVHLTYYVYLSEFTDPKNKDSITMLSGATAAAGYFLQPLLAYFLIPLKFKWVVVEDWIFFGSWKIFLIISSVPPLLGFFISLFCIDETPKFLLLNNRNEESIRILKEIYVENTGNAPDTYTVADISLQEDKEIIEEMKKQPQQGSFSKSIRQIKPLFKYPYIIPALMAFAAQVITMGAFNAIRPYIPILFSLALGFGQTEANSTAPSATAEKTPFCTLFETQQIFKSKVKCAHKHVELDQRIFLGSIIVGLCVFLSFFPFKKIVNVVGKVTTFVLAHVISAFAIFLFPFSVSVYGLVIICIYSICMQNSLTIVIGLMISRTPTTMRGITISMVMVFGRIGVILGNQILPIITDLSCKAGFWAIGCVNLLSLPIMFVFSRQPNPVEELVQQNATTSRSTSPLPTSPSPKK
ncbi:synaptic vesicle glycoprotein 2B-like [Planococcus citri]|uniref:synaptic vesicle glycoprotein 2B-like n=1 Tax=Planococcus citri TaxID=170843 RepID=UPI0031F9C5E3